MPAKPFLDTNILIYAFAAGDPRNERAEVLLEAGGVISVQVLNEFVNVSRRRLHRSWDDIETEVQILRTLLDPPVSVTIELHDAAITQARVHGFSFYDALIVTAAMRSGCKVLYTEDLHDGLTIGGLQIRNPFR
jgi:predicted nucleic acid-binding protein